MQEEGGHRQHIAQVKRVYVTSWCNSWGGKDRTVVVQEGGWEEVDMVIAKHNKEKKDLCGRKRRKEV